MEPDDFRLLLDRLEYSGEGYRKVRRGVQRRIARHMQALGCVTMADYLDRIAVDEAARLECERRMTVSISRFFRDEQVWEALRTRVLPALIEPTRGPVRVWSAGCSGGEEIYSFKILWRETEPNAGRDKEPTALATDLNSENLERAQKGIFGPGSFKRVPVAVRERWFRPLPGAQTFRIDPSLQEGIIWRVHDLRRDPPPENRIDLLFLRNNVLTYCKRELRRRVVERLLPALAPGGVLVIGARERLPAGVEGLEPLAGCRCAYINRPDPPGR